MWYEDGWERAGFGLIMHVARLMAGLILRWFVQIAHYQDKNEQQT